MLSMGNVWDASCERGASIGVSQGKITVGQEEDTKKKSELGVEEVVGRENRGTGIGVCGKEEGKKMSVLRRDGGVVDDKR